MNIEYLKYIINNYKLIAIFNYNPVNLNLI